MNDQSAKQLFVSKCTTSKVMMHWKLVSMTLVVIGLLWLLPTASFAQAQDANGYYYTVQSGDYWDSISRRTGVPTFELKEANPQSVRANNWLRIGEKLFIPTAAQLENVEHIVERGESWSSIAAQYGSKASLLKALNPRSVRFGDIIYRGERLLIPGQPISNTGTAETESSETGVADSNQENAGDSSTTGSASTTDESIAGDGNTENNVAADNTSGGATETENNSTSSADTGTAQVSDGTADNTTAVSSGQPTDTGDSAGSDSSTDTAANVVTSPGAAGDDGAETVIASAPTATPEPRLPNCPTEFGAYADTLLAVLNSPLGGIDILPDFIESCGASVDKGITVADLTGDGVDDLVVVYDNVIDEVAHRENGLLIISGGDPATAAPYTLGYRAKTDGEIKVIAIEDANEDGQLDVAWVDTTCGASTCFNTVNVRSWDGNNWLDWTEGAIKMAYAEINLGDVGENASSVDGTTGARVGDGQGKEIVLSGGVYGSVGAGPQRGRIETWGSVDGAPYAKLNEVYNESECLYHTVLDANRAFLDARARGFDGAESLYTAAISNDELTKCWVRNNELDELRSFSLFRLGVIAGYKGRTEAVADYIGELGATYPGSIYDQVGSTWLTAYQESSDVFQACAAANRFAGINEEAWKILVDYGYTNPSFSAEDVCPILEGINVVQPVAPPLENSSDGSVGEEGNSDVSDGSVDVASDTGEAPVEDNAANDSTVETDSLGDSGAVTESNTAEADTAEGGATESVATDQGVTEDVTSAETASDTGDDVATTHSASTAQPRPEEVELPTCPVDLDQYAAVVPQVLNGAKGDALIVETWLRMCDAMSDDRGSVQLIDLNADGTQDALVFPTILSDTGFGPGGTQGTVLVYHANQDGVGNDTYTLAIAPETYGKPTFLALDDLNADGLLDLAWSVQGCSTFCLTEVRILTWDGASYTSAIQLGAMIAEGTVGFEPVAEGSPGQGQQLVLNGGLSNTPEGGLSIEREEIWQSVNGNIYRRIQWQYDQDAEENDCFGLKLVEADVALQASNVLGYGPAIDLYAQALDAHAASLLRSCSIFDGAGALTPEEEMSLLQGLASFRLAQAYALSGDLESAVNTVDALAEAEPDAQYTQAALGWLSSYSESADAMLACQSVQPIFDLNDELWLITDHYGYNHPTLAAEQLCFEPM